MPLEPLIHGHGEIRHELVWRVATAHLVALVRQLAALLAELPAP